MLRGEREDGRGGDGLARLQLRGWEVGLVGRVREVLGLERVARALAVGVTADADQGSVEEVAGVHLYTGLVRPHGELTAAVRVPGVGGEVEPVRAGGGRRLRAQHPVVVITLGDLQLVE